MAVTAAQFKAMTITAMRTAIPGVAASITFTDGGTAVNGVQSSGTQLGREQIDGSGSDNRITIHVAAADVPAAYPSAGGKVWVKLAGESAYSEYRISPNGVRTHGSILLSFTIEPLGKHQKIQ